MSFTFYIHYRKQRYGVLLPFLIHAAKFVSTGLDRKNKEN